jgi:hypothetical protein
MPPDHEKGEEEREDIGLEHDKYTEPSHDKDAERDDMDGICNDKEDLDDHADDFADHRHCAPVWLRRAGRSLQFGRTSAPIMPHLVQTALRSRSRSTVSSGQRSASTTALWWQ